MSTLRPSFTATQPPARGLGFVMRRGGRFGWELLDVDVVDRSVREA